MRSLSPRGRYGAFINRVEPVSVEKNVRSFVNRHFARFILKKITKVCVYV